MDTAGKDEEPQAPLKQENKNPSGNKRNHAWVLFWGSALAYLAVWGYIFTIFYFAVSLVAHFRRAKLSLTHCSHRCNKEEARSAVSTISLRVGCSWFFKFHVLHSHTPIFSCAQNTTATCQTLYTSSCLSSSRSSQRLLWSISSSSKIHRESLKIT